jgi:hypothetical protein
VVLLLSFVALGIIFGAAGIIVAAPLSIALYVVVREFYVGDLLKEHDQLTRLGERKPSARKRARERKRAAAEAAKDEAEADADSDAER